MPIYHTGPSSANFGGVKPVKILPLGSAPAPKEKTGLLADLEGAVAGIPLLAQALAGDAVRAATLGKYGPDAFSIDDIGKGIAADYAHTYGPALSGDFGTSWDRMKEHPLGPITDAMTILTGGLGAAGKIGKFAAITAGSEKGAKIAGLTKIGHKADFADELPKGTYKVGRDGTVWQQKAKTRKNGLGEEVPIGVSSTNPLRRFIDENVKAPISETKLLRDVPMIGADRKIGRVNKKGIDIAEDNALGHETLLFRKKVGKLNPQQKYALVKLMDGVTPEEDYRFANAMMTKAAGHIVDDTKGGAKRIRASLKKSGTPAALNEARQRVADLDAAERVGKRLNKTQLQNREMLRNQIAKGESHLKELDRLEGEAAVAHPQMYGNLKRVRQIEDWGLDDLENVYRNDPKVAEAFDLAQTIDRRYGAKAIEIGLVSPEDAMTRRLLSQRIVRMTEHAPTDGRPEPIYRTLTIEGTTNKRNIRKKAEGLTLKQARDQQDPLVILRQGAAIRSAAKGYAATVRALELATPVDVRELTKVKGSWVHQPSGTKVEVLNSKGGLEKVMRRFVELSDDKLKAVWDEEDEILDLVHKAIADAMQEVVPSSGKVKVLPSSTYHALTEEFRTANSLLMRMFDKTTKLWRDAVLSLRPGWITSNIVGQMILLYLAQGPYRATKGLIQGYGKKGKIVDPHIAHLKGTSFSAVQGADLARGTLGKSKNPLRRIATAMTDLNKRVSDDNTRKAAFLAELDPRVAELRKLRPELSWEIAAKHVMDDPIAMDDMTRSVLGDLIDFGDLSEVERKVVRRLLPFWAWMKGMTQRSVAEFLDHPARSSMALAAGGNLTDQNEAEHGGMLPSYLKGAFFTGDDTAITNQAYNPFQTPLDLLSQGRALLPGQSSGAPENPLNGINPVFRAALEASSGHDFFYGNDLDPNDDKGAIRLYAEQLFGATPQVRMAQRGTDLPGVGKHSEIMDKGSYLYEPRLEDYIAAYFGIPVKHINMATARKRGREESALKD